ncbi:MarR family winged helix-turn-helix transcriptional regulator [Actinomadura sp. WMMB 499]|uniref:MarR family winged helix-turn-helix transcriptional regulator n=1 Tax=Actinomadura sp. WMMB 499 TaxID=1219491 RepID=UPI0012479068|nr:MarR family winged helix-turn-helix transcriptional regulator [Actinomadura sp. WMMB 499]QFG23324.1 winged helix-turn-helix transcriptional regulator [Actinomadura sp. WMMB 499]
MRLADAIDELAGSFVSVWEARHLAAPVPATQLRVLFAVERQGTINVTGVAAELDALLSSASRLCSRMETAGLLERTPGPNRRVIAYRLSSQGAAMLAELRSERRRDLAEVLLGMEADDRRTLLDGLRCFREAGGARPGASAEVPESA